MALFAFIVASYSFIFLFQLDYNDGKITYLFVLYLAIVFGCMAMLAELDGFSRYQNYKQVKDQIYFNGYQERLLKPLLRSSCQREAAILASTELGIGDKAKEYFYSKGYRWYHIIPDFVFQYPLFFFSIYFWRTTFFTPYYKAKVNFDELDLSRIDLSLKGIELERAE